ncbi:MAG: response regulator [Candidatus Hermodarchaeia archaeon]|jgi:thioredoxin reductase (NADPH)
MNKPFIITVDDDANVLKMIDLDLRNRYGEQYRVFALNSGKAAMDYLHNLKAQSDQVALFLVDQRMPQMTGVEFLGQARMIYPAAKRVLLTAYADTEAAMAAINQVGLDYYLMKPWSPPAEKLYPILDDLLRDWLSVMFPPGIRDLG